MKDKKQEKYLVAHYDIGEYNGKDFSITRCPYGMCCGCVLMHVASLDCKKCCRYRGINESKKEVYCAWWE